MAIANGISVNALPRMAVELQLYDIFTFKASKKNIKMAPDASCMWPEPFISTPDWL